MLPLAAVINKRIFCVHGGIPRTICKREPNILKTISGIQRPLFQPLKLVVVKDILWSDPASPESEDDSSFFIQSPRGSDNKCFCRKAVELFLLLSGCSHIIRAHQYKSYGLQYAKNGKVITVFSSSHYCKGILIYMFLFI